ncbi:hypothetical protein X975_17489, partial [Stegodyphus mimosarum]
MFKSVIFCNNEFLVVLEVAQNIFEATQTSYSQNCFFLITCQFIIK